MNEIIKNIRELRIQKASENLKGNNMEVFFANKKEDVIPIVKNLIKEGSIVANGGSMTLEECGVFDFLRSGNYNFLDREGLTREEAADLFIKSFSADAYLCSCNAITENGELYNVDGTSNRIAAISYGPKTVIMVVGYNKIVRNIDEAIIRVKKNAAPANAKRLSSNTYCEHKGECLECSSESEMTSGCNGDSRICCNYLISARQRVKGRIKIIIVGEELGY